MIIKIITYQNFPYGGAAANFMRYFSLSLAKEGHDVEVVLPAGNIYGNNIESKCFKEGFVDNVKYRHLCFKNHPKNYLGKLLSLLCGLILPFEYLFRKKNRGLIIIYNTRFTHLLPLILLKTLLNEKLVIVFPEFYRKPKKGIIKLYHWYNFYFGLKYLSRYADGYIPVTNYMRKYLQESLKINKPIKVLPNLMDPRIFNIDNVTPYLKSKITIGYAGTPTYKDGVDDLIIAFSKLHKKYSNTHLLIIGDVINGKSVIADLKIKAKKLNIIENVTFTGLVPFKTIPKLFSSCQILAMTRPSGVFAEAGFPTKLGEYFASKKPVLITKVGDIPYYFENKKHLIIAEPENIDSIVSGFEAILTNNKNLVDKMSNHAYNWMNENLNYLNVSKKLSDFICTV